MHPSVSSSSFGKRICPSRRRLNLHSKYRPAPLKSCLASSDSGRDSNPSEEPHVRKTVHFPDDKLFLEQVRTIPARPDLTKKGIFKRGQIAETKSFLMYTSNPLGTNQRFLSKLPGSSGPRYESHSQWMSVVRARYLAAAYVSQPRSPRSAPSSDESVFDMSSLKEALPEPASGSSVHGSAFDMSSLTDALPEPNDTFNMRSLVEALPEAALKPRGFASDMSSLKRALPDPDAPSEAPSRARAPKSMVAPHSRDLPPKVRVAGGYRSDESNRSTETFLSVNVRKAAERVVAQWDGDEGGWWVSLRRIEPIDWNVPVSESEEGSRTCGGFILFSFEQSVWWLNRSGDGGWLAGIVTTNRTDPNGTSLFMNARKTAGHVVTYFPIYPNP
ncbi:hypothetical protein PITC_073580 [Penicillium italicum]|uniref:Uncharacterized protein n=1 Tax=Penicillium italicum TaxID=40296 RepID=A0A0A2KK94_PENIT|nr:hypothetical protein PITC_073580 [Penicillium italicum]